jgi:hypothetical protein
LDITNITNAKIEKTKADIEKTKAKIAEYQAKQKEQEKLLRHYEDLEIVARFRQRMAGDEDLGAVFHAGDTMPGPSGNDAAALANNTAYKEGHSNADTEN